MRPGTVLNPIEQRDHLVGYLNHLKYLLASHEGYLKQLRQSKKGAEDWARGIRDALRQSYVARPEEQGAVFAREYRRKREQDRQDLQDNEGTIEALVQRMEEPTHTIASLKGDIIRAKEDLEEAKGAVEAFASKQQQQQQQAVQSRRVSPAARARSPVAPDATVISKLNGCLEDHPVRLINRLYTSYAVVLQIDTLVEGVTNNGNPGMIRRTDWRRTGRYVDLLKLAETFYDIRTDTYKRVPGARNAWLRLLIGLAVVSVGSS